MSSYNTSPKFSGLSFEYDSGNVIGIVLVEKGISAVTFYVGIICTLKREEGT